MKLSRRDLVLYILAGALGIWCSIVWTPIVADFYRKAKERDTRQLWIEEQEQLRENARLKRLEERNKRIPINGVPL